MKIYDKTLQEIFSKLPLPYKALVCSGTAFIAMVLVFIFIKIININISFNNNPTLEIYSMGKEITNQINPSITGDKDKNIIAFSAQSENIRNIRLLKSIKKGDCSKWLFINQGIEGKVDTIVSPNNESEENGLWSIETPSIVYDPDDKGKEWKLFAYKYFWSSANNLEKAIETAKKYSVITYKYSSNPESEWSNEEWIFSPDSHTPPNPYNKLVKHRLNKLSPELKNVTSYSRPSVIYQDGILLMALSAFTNQPTPDRTILIASEDHGKSWIYIGSAIGQNEAKFFDNLLYKGATLIQHKYGIYIAATFGNQNTDTKTYIIKFQDPGKAIIYRDKNDKPIITKEFGLFNSNSVSGGFPTYNQFCKNDNIIVSEKDKDSGKYKLFITNEDIIK